LLLFAGEGLSRPAIVCRVPPGSMNGHAGEVTLDVEGQSLTVTGWRSDAATLSDLLHDELSGLNPGTRRDLLDSIVSACAPELDGNDSTRLCRNLALVRDFLRDPLPHVSVGEDESLSVVVEELLAIDERSFWMRGWIWNAAGDLSGMTMVSPEGVRTQVLDGLFRYPRPDVDSTYVGRGSKDPHKGFFAFFEIAVPSRLSEGWVVELHHASGIGVEVKAPPVYRNMLDIRGFITKYVGEVWRDKNTLVNEHASPALTRLQARLEESVEVERTVQCGPAPHAPDITIIVPLLDRLDALEQQLCQLSNDPDVQSSDLLYVLDSQQDAWWLAPKALELHDIYGIPFRLAVLSETAGRTVMINKAASLARAKRLLLLSPDVVPVARGWLREMTTFYDSQEMIGALGPMLLYEDETLHHAGQRLDPVAPQESGLFDGNGVEARSRFQGVPDSLPEANEAAPVAAVSGACLMVDRTLFEEAGELRNIYAEGHAEDTDLCLRLRDAGRRNWYVPTARLYYLEGRSEPAPTPAGRQYNALLLDQLWGEHLATGRGLGASALA
jgi:hypothetical protein